MNLVRKAKKNLKHVQQKSMKKSPPVSCLLSPVSCLLPPVSCLLSPVSSSLSSFDNTKRHQNNNRAQWQTAGKKNKTRQETNRSAEHPRVSEGLAQVVKGRPNAGIHLVWGPLGLGVHAGNRGLAGLFPLHPRQAAGYVLDLLRGLPGALTDFLLNDVHDRIVDGVPTVIKKLLPDLLCLGDTRTTHRNTEDLGQVEAAKGVLSRHVLSHTIF